MALSFEIFPARAHPIIRPFLFNIIKLLIAQMRCLFTNVNPNKVVLGKRSCLYDQRALFPQYLFEDIYIWVVHKLQSRGNDTCDCRDIVNDYQVVALI